MEPRAPETAGAPPPRETRYSREQVLGAFNTAFELFQNEPDAALSKEQKYARNAITEAKRNTLDATPPKSTFTNKFERLDPTQPKYHQEEGIPIDELADFLTQKIEDLAATNPADPDIEKYTSARDILLNSNNSRRFSSIPVRMQPARLVGRTRQEAYYISQNPEMQTGSMDGDYFAAYDILMKRVELVVPPVEVSEEEAAAEAPPAEAETAAPTPAPAPLVETPDTQPPRTDEDTRLNTIEEIVYDAYILNRNEDLERRAREMAEEQLRNQMREGRWFDPRAIFRKIKLRVAEEYYRQLYHERARQAMLANNNAYLTMNLTDVRNAAIQATHKIAEEREAGRSKIEQTKLEETPTTTLEGEIKQRIVNDILKPLIKGTIDETGVQAALRRIVEENQNNAEMQGIFGRNATQYGRLAEYFATDLQEIAKRIRDDRGTNDAALANIDNVVNLRIANAKWAAQTDANFNTVDKIIASLQSRKSTAWLVGNPAAAGAIASLVTFGATRAIGRGAGAVPIAGTLFGAGFAALRRNSDLKRDMATHRVERAYGMQTPEGARRREALDNYSYNTASVNELLDGGRDPGRSEDRRTVGGDTRGLRELIRLDLTDINNQAALIRRMEEIRARLDLSTAHRIDLVTFEGREKVEQGRLQLVKALVESKQALRRAEVPENTMSDVGRTARSEWDRLLITDGPGSREQQDRAFARYRLRNAAGAALFGGIAGLAGGLVSQEAIAAGARGILEIPGADNALPWLKGLTGETVGERLWKDPGRVFREPIGDLFTRSRSPGFARDYAEDLYRTPSSRELVPGINMVSQPGADGSPHPVSFIDTTTGQTLASGNLTPDGKTVIPTRLEDLPQQLRAVVAGPNWETPEQHEYQAPPATPEPPKLPPVQPDQGFDIGKAKTVYENHPASVQVADNLKMHVGRVIPGLPGQPVPAEGFVQAKDYYPVSFTDVDGHPIDMPPAYLTPDNKLVISGNTDNLPAVIKKFVNDPGWQTGESHAPTNLQDAIQKALNTNTHEVFRHGNTEIALNPKEGTFSIKDFPNNIEVHGTIGADKSLVIDPKGPDNADISPAEWTKIKSRLNLEAWGFAMDKTPAQPAAGTVIDQLVSNPDLLKQNGVIETDQFKKTWNFHVLRPDIVSSTGMHTHNELTLHLGGQYTVDSGPAPVVRTGVGKPGWITFTGNIDGGLIPSHLAGVPPATDQVLKGIIDKSNGLKFTDMAFVVDMNDGKQFMAQIQELPQPDGSKQYGFKLPDALHTPTGELVGIKSIASAIITKPDGTAIKAGELLANGQVPEGSIVHSLASEKFKSVEPPSAQPIPGREVIKLTPPKMTEFVPPQAPAPSPPLPPIEPIPQPSRFETVLVPKAAVFNEQAPFIPIPFAPRHPLEPLRRPHPVVPPISPPYGYGRGEYGIPPSRPISEEALEDSSGVLLPADEVLGAGASAPTASPTGRPTPTSAGTSSAEIEVPAVVTGSTTASTSASATSGTILAGPIALRDKKEKLRLFLVDEVQTPVAPADRAEAVRRAEEFVSSPEVEDAKRAGGLNEEAAVELYQKILVWLKANSIPALESDDPSLDSDLKSYTEEAVRLFYDSDPEDVIRKRANLIAKFARDNGIFDYSVGDPLYNLFAFVALYDKVKDLTLT